MNVFDLGPSKIFPSAALCDNLTAKNQGRNKKLNIYFPDKPSINPIRKVAAIIATT